MKSVIINSKIFTRDEIVENKAFPSRFFVFDNDLDGKLLFL